MIYLDNAASTPDLSRPTSPTHIDDWGGYGNSHSIHAAGMEAAKYIGTAESVIKWHINGHEGTILWTGSGSQANLLAIDVLERGRTVRISAIEHKSILLRPSARCSWAKKTIQSDFYGVLPSNIQDIVYTNQAVSVQLVNNETGVIQPIKQMRASVPDNYFHTDAVQAFGKIPIDVEDLGVDMLTFSSHKVYGPKGLGGLWVHNRVLDKVDFPYLGTKPTELICRLASVLPTKDEIYFRRGQVSTLEKVFLRGLGTGILPSSAERLPGMLSIYFPGVDNDTLVFELSKQGIMISSGSACDNGKVGPSHVLTAMGISEKQATETVRVSLSHLNTIDEVQTAARTMAETIERIRNGQ